MKCKIWILLICITFTISCTKVSTSPEEFNLRSPYNIQFEIVSLSSVKLTWQDRSENEEGYIIEKIFMGEIIDSTNLPENSVEFVDEDMIPGRNYSYKVYSFHEEMVRGSRIDIVNTFPSQIFELEYEIIDSTTVRLTWNEQYDFEHGFKIDKSIDWDNWEDEVAIVGENSVEWIDTNYHGASYRIYPFVNEYNGEKRGINVSTFYNIHYVVLSSFYSSVYDDQNEINIGWTTQAESENVLWNIIRGENENAIWNSEVILVNEDPVAGAGVTTEPTDYDYMDNYNLEMGVSYYYWLENYNSLGVKMLYGPISCTYY